MPGNTGLQDMFDKGVRRIRARQDAFGFLNETPRSDAPFELMPVDAEGLRDAIAIWTGLGHAITFGRTQDGGAMGVHLHAGGERRSRYFGTVAELEDFLATVRGADAPK